MKTIISERDLAELRELYIQANKEKFAAKKKWEKDVLNNSLEYMEKTAKVGILIQVFIILGIDFRNLEE